MNFASVRIITEDVDRLVKFYEKVMGVSAERPAPVFAELVIPSCTLAIGHLQTVPLFGAGSAVAADNHSVIIEFRIYNIDVEYERLKPFVDEWVKEPTMMPWGNRAMLFRDPDGNLVNLFEPVTEASIKRFSRRG
ncbi:VOC family protein [Paraliobacillus zengyii]|uniref:VOC family protein n=1 Tax=Paraliobacillus zengyii TaxID=2213194 RepID=UPI000DD2EED8|nr:VOC family protein [Paraliobacillus zengyii]